MFQAFKEVEVRVRQAGGFADTDIGVQLMSKAFHPESGPLTDRSAVKGEQQALADLFAGAIGSYKNPHSRRSVTIDADEAVEMIVLHRIRWASWTNVPCETSRLAALLLSLSVSTDESAASLIQISEIKGEIW